MTLRGRRSRKHSAASSSARPLESSAIFYVDESIYSRLLDDALQSAGVIVRRPGVDIPFGTPDQSWLQTAGKSGWIVLMRDQRVRHRPLEIQALRTAGVAAFVFTAGQATAQLTADVLTPKLRTMVNISMSERRPFLYTVSAAGAMARFKLRGK